MEKHFFNRYMKSLKHNLLFELSRADIRGYNRNKSQWNSTIYRFLAGSFQFSQIPELLRNYRSRNLGIPDPSPHDAAIAWCLLESLGRELMEAGLVINERNPFDFNVARVRHFSVCVPALRALCFEVMPLLIDESFGLSNESLHGQFPALASQAEKKLKHGVAKMRELRTSYLGDAATVSLHSLFDLATMVRLFGEIATWGVDDYPTNRFLGLE